MARIPREAVSKLMSSCNCYKSSLLFIERKDHKGCFIGTWLQSNPVFSVCTKLEQHDTKTIDTYTLYANCIYDI
jgi:hypothetical protein